MVTKGLYRFADPKFPTCDSDHLICMSIFSAFRAFRRFYLKEILTIMNTRYNVQHSTITMNFFYSLSSQREIKSLIGNNSETRVWFTKEVKFKLRISFNDKHFAVCIQQ